MIRDILKLCTGNRGGRANRLAGLG